jgi:hypothetical protein
MIISFNYRILLAIIMSTIAVLPAQSRPFLQHVKLITKGIGKTFLTAPYSTSLLGIYGHYSQTSSIRNKHDLLDKGILIGSSASWLLTCGTNIAQEYEQSNAWKVTLPLISLHSKTSNKIRNATGGLVGLACLYTLWWQTQGQQFCQDQLPLIGFGLVHGWLLDKVGRAALS